MKFINEQHENFYHEYKEKCNSWDSYYQALIYTLGISDNIRKHIEDVYTVDDGIQVTAFDHAWLTSSDRAVISLAFNLFNGTNENAEVDSIFSMSYDYAPYFLEAIKLRYKSYFKL